MDYFINNALLLKGIFPKILPEESVFGMAMRNRLTCSRCIY